MNFPLWEVPLLGGGLVIALIAIPHVFVSHFAIGGGIFLAWTERRALKENDSYMLEFVRKNTLFFVLVTLVFGAVTGVGIWYSISLVHPPATSALIHNFVFGWAIEWVFFVIEIAAALIYHYSWDRVSPKVHNTIGWIYAVSAWMSLVVINGILTFMLTPGAWLVEGGFWTGFFNPTYFPSVAVRTFVCLALAWLYMLFRASCEEPSADRDRLVKYISKWLLPALVGLPVFGGWFILEMPQMAREMTQGAAAAVTMFAAMSVLLSGVLAVFAYIAGYRNPSGVTPQWTILLMVLGLAVTGSTEWVREAVRKPYVIHGYMYSNGIQPPGGIQPESGLTGPQALAQEVDRLRSVGILSQAKWTTVREITPQNELEAGRQIFTLQCENCHTIQGYNGIRLLIKGWDEPYLMTQIEYLNVLKNYMPPFAGNDAERQALARWLLTLNEPRTAAGGGE